MAFRRLRMSSQFEVVLTDQDFAISVAAIHHLSTTERRMDAMRVSNTVELLKGLMMKALLPPLFHATSPPYSRFMIYVWAYEQGENSKRKMGTAAGAEGSADEKVQDVLVPWVLTPKPVKKEKVIKPRRVRGEPVVEQEAAPVPVETVPVEGPKVFHRYYHLFVKGELGDNVRQAGRDGGYEVVEAEDGEAVGKDIKWLRIVGEGWEADNWWLEGEVGIGPRKAE